MSLPFKSGSFIVRRLTLSAVRSAATGDKGIVPNTAAYKRIMEKQKFYLTDDGKYVWQKTAGSRALYNLTVALCAGGTVLCFYKAYIWSYPAK